MAAARKNVLEKMEDCELIRDKRYRLNPENIKLVFELVNTTLYSATGKMQLCNADDWGILQPSVMDKKQEGNVRNVPLIILNYLIYQYKEIT